MYESLVFRSFCCLKSNIILKCISLINIMYCIHQLINIGNPLGQELLLQDKSELPCIKYSLYVELSLPFKYKSHFPQVFQASLLHLYLSGPQTRLSSPEVFAKASALFYFQIHSFIHACSNSLECQAQLMLGEEQ